MPSGHAWMSDYICMYIFYLCRTHTHTHTHKHTHTHTWICVYEFTNKKCFSRCIWIHACASLWIKTGFPDLPFQDGHKLVVCTDSVICSVTSGVFTADSACARLLQRLFLGLLFSTHFHKKHKNSVYVFLYGTSRLSLKEESVWLPSITICIK